jgi:putative ABC transport system permease protein
MKVNALLIENIKVALQAIRSHMLRSGLTMLIVAFGITALVGIFASIDAIKYTISDNFQLMGANTFSITNRQLVFSDEDRPKRYTHVSYDQALDFQEQFEFPGRTSIHAYASGSARLKSEHAQTNPNISVIGANENYLATSGGNLDKGRNFSNHDMQNGAHVAIIGSEIANKLFPKLDPINKIISVGAARYRVIGVLEAKGASMGFGGDRNCLIPLSTLRHNYYRPRMNFTISFMTEGPEMLDVGVGEAIGTFRTIRKLKLDEEDNFSIRKSDNIAEMLISNLRYLSLAATIIAFITLLGASVGLMNIMLVTVNERTREIGIRKAIGANNKTIRQQFLTEAIAVTVLGGLLGIVFGIIIGNVVSKFTGGGFLIPWLWIFVGLAVSMVVGLVSGLFPAVKASKLDPIESLRFE